MDATKSFKKLALFLILFVFLLSVLLFQCKETEAGRPLLKLNGTTNSNLGVKGGIMSSFFDIKFRVKYSGPSHGGVGHIGNHMHNVTVKKY